MEAAAPARLGPILRTTSLLAALLLAAPLPAHAQGKLSKAATRDQIRFARHLAAEWGFVDLSETILAEVEERGFPSDLEEEVALGRCDVFAEGAKKTSDPVQRDELYEKAIKAYEDFIYDHPYSEEKDTAQTALIEATSRLGKSLSLKLADAAGEEAEELRQRVQEALSSAVGMTGDLIAGLKSEPERTSAQDRRLYALLFNRGTMLLEVAKTQEDGSFSFDQSLKSFEDLVYTAGEDTPWGLRAYIGMGDNYASQLLWDDAASFFEFVVGQAWPRDEEFWAALRKESPPTPGELQQRFLFVQFGIEGLIDALRQGGRTEEAVDWGLFYYNLWKREGLDLVKPVGDLGMLATARALLETGGYVGGSLNDGAGQWYATRDEMQSEHSSRRQQRTAIDLALTIAQQVNQENRGNVLQVRAQKLISEIISRPGVVVAPDVLFEAAMGEYFNQEYGAAVDSFKRVLASLAQADEAARVEFGPKVHFRLGASLSRLDRDLEAAMVHREALENWRGDPEFDERNAKAMYEILSAYRRRASGDSIIDGLWRESENWVSQVGQDTGDIDFRKADRAYKTQDYEQALELFRAVAADATRYEVALVQIGVCQYQLGDLKGAEKTLRDYLEVFLKDPVNTTTDPTRQAYRTVAEASANYYLGQIAFDRARTGETEWSEVVTWLGGFNERFPNQDDLAPAALWRVLIARLRMDEIQEVRAVYDTMVAEFRDSKWTGRASLDIYRVLERQREAAQEAGEADRVRALTTDMATFLEIGNSLSSEPSFANLRRESAHWMELREWEKAEADLRRLVDLFGDDPEEAESVDKYVRPDLGKALLQQQKVEDAVAYLKPLIDSKQANRETARVYALALVGWAELVDERTVGEIPGIGTAEAFEEGSELLNQLAASETKWELPWYQAKFDWFYGYTKWGALDGKKLETARSELRKMYTTLEKDWSLVGDPALATKYAWLWGKLE